MASTSLSALANSTEGLIDAASRLKNDAPKSSQLKAIIERGEFRPLEDEAIGYWFARFLTVRADLWSVISDARDALASHSKDDDEGLRFFLVGYAAACTLVGIDRFLIFEIASHSIVQRKLNEPFPELRIPRKQFTQIFEAFVNEKDALALLDAMQFAKRHRRRLRSMRTDSSLGRIAEQLPIVETALDPSIREYIRGAWAYISHKWRRRGVVSANNVLAGISESVGRAASNVYIADRKNVTDEVRATIGDLLQPGDVLITRHAIALTNLFMPGFWPHAAFYVGTPTQREKLQVRVPEDKMSLWGEGICTLEALKDGVRFRPLAETLAVDFFVVLRPQIASASVREAIERGSKHEGKMYNFDFDFFSSDRLVCTEVIYRAYDGVDGIEFPLAERAGRKTLSAEDLLDYALDTPFFEPVAIFGTEGCANEIAFGSDVRDLLRASYDSGKTS